MENSGIVPVKICLYQENGVEPEIRRFGLSVSDSSYSSFKLFLERLAEIFPLLREKTFKIHWKDEDGDEVTISTPDELSLALDLMKTDVKKFIVRVRSEPGDVAEDKKRNVSHPFIYCDGCESNIVGFRYKCLLCHDFDICESCERAGAHAQHPMLRSLDPQFFKQANLHKISHVVESSTMRHKHRERKHSYDGGYFEEGYPEGHKKHKKFDKRESGPETGDESEESCHKKHSHHGHHGHHKKWKKMGKCPYSQMMGDVLSYLTPNTGSTEGAGAAERNGPGIDDSAHANYLKTVGMTLKKFLDPFGVEVDFEVRPNEGQKGDKKDEGKEAEGAKKGDAPPPTPSAQKEVRFAEETWKQKVDEIANTLAKQTMNNNGGAGSSRSSENNDWVTLEELQKDCADSQPSPNATVPTTAPTAPEVSHSVSNENTSNTPNIYPSLNTEPITDPVIRESLEKMLSMGFTNEGNWLVQLLKAKKGSIEQALEVLAPYKKN